MKKAVFTLLAVLLLGAQIFAQDTGTKEEIELEDLRKEMQGKMDAMKAEMETAMQDMQIMMQELQMNSVDGKNEIIINGDTIIVAPGEALPGNLGDVFKQMPENMEGMDFFFGGSEFDDLFGMMEQFQGDVFDMDNLGGMVPPMKKEERGESKEKTNPENKEDKKPATKEVKKKRKTYSL